MSNNANGSLGSSQKSNHRTYTSLLNTNGKSKQEGASLECHLWLVTQTDRLSGSFGPAFWHTESTNNAACSSNEEAWSVTANTSTVDKTETTGAGSESCEDEQVKQTKRVA